MTEATITSTIAQRQLDAYAPAIGDLVDMHAVVRRYYVGHFFDADTMRFFGSRVAAYGYRGADGAVYFVTSERDSGPYAAWDGERRYTVRRWHPAEPHTIDDVGGFGQYRSRQVANAAVQRIARTGTADARRRQ